MLLLVKPYFESHVITPVIGLGYISSYLKANGFEVKIIDAVKENISNDTIVEYANKIKPEAIGISVLSLYTKEAFDLSRKLKAYGHKVIIGGVHPTYEPYKTLTDSKCDYVIAGEGELPFLALAKNNYENNNIKGVYSLDNLKNENQKFEIAESIQDLDSIPFPDWEQINPYTYPIAPHGVVVKKPPVAGIMASRGCPYSCMFCSSSNLYRKSVRFRSPKNVVDEMEYLNKKFNVKEIQFLDDNLTLKKDYVLSICQQIIDRKLKIHWSCPNGIRADRFDEEIAAKMKKSGCYLLTFGVESADNTVLTKMKKNESIETIENAINIAHRHKFITTGNFILGFPCDNINTINKTIRFAENSKLDLAQFAIFRLLPGSELYNRIVKNNPDIKIDDSCSSFAGVEYIPESLKDYSLIDLQGKAFRHFYLKPHRFLNSFKFIHLNQIKYLFMRLKEYHFFKLFR
ncbi:B12-binding domain-containing radical SAM protein [bacterium]|nr:B12-binding domain-containing radical SAM protein [bacterium]